MDDTTHINLIKQLAQSTGMVDAYDSKYQGAHYDESTGTFYCEGLVIPHNSIENALKFFKRQMNTYKDAAAHDKTLLEMYMNYAVATNAIIMLSDNVRNIKEELKDDNG